jgi:hypothetical protein
MAATRVAACCGAMCTRSLYSSCASTCSHTTVSGGIEAGWDAKIKRRDTHPPHSHLSTLDAATATISSSHLSQHNRPPTLASVPREYGRRAGTKVFSKATPWRVAHHFVPARALAWRAPCVAARTPLGALTGGAHGAWRMAHGAWRMAHGAWRIGSTPSESCTRHTYAVVRCSCRHGTRVWATCLYYLSSSVGQAKRDSK